MIIVRDIRSKIEPNFMIIRITYLNLLHVVISFVFSSWIINEKLEKCICEICKIPVLLFRIWKHVFFRIETEICGSCSVDPFNLRAATSRTFSHESYLNFPRFLISWTQKVHCSSNEGFYCAIAKQKACFCLFNFCVRVLTQRLCKILT